MVEITGIYSSGCSLSWTKIKEMKENKVEFWAADGFNLLKIVDIDEKGKNLYMINQSGKITWPLKYEKLETLHDKIHNGDLILLPYEIDKLVPTWGNYVAGLLKYLGCSKD